MTIWTLSQRRNSEAACVLCGGHFAPPRIKVSGMSKKRGAIREDDQWPMVNDRHTRIMVNGYTGMVIISITILQGSSSSIMMIAFLMIQVSYLY